MQFFKVKSRYWICKNAINVFFCCLYENMSFNNYCFIKDLNILIKIAAIILQEQHAPFIVPGRMSVNRTICSSCFSSYKNLSDFYSTIDPNFDGHFCMDLSDAVRNFNLFEVLT